MEAKNRRLATFITTNSARKWILLAALLTTLVAIGHQTAERSRPAKTASAPSRSEFRQLLQDLSEPEGYFDTDNFISNETSYLHVIPGIRRFVRSGGVYLGVGPDQNFSYLAHIQPSLAIVVDIRRQNMLQHLWYKALFELSNSRADFLTLMFSRSSIPTIAQEPLERLLERVAASPANDDTRARAQARIRSAVTETFGIPLSDQDWQKIDLIEREFHDENLSLRFSSWNGGGGIRYPTLQEMLLATDRNGSSVGYLSSEELFQWLKRFQHENRLIPVTGDFGKTTAFSAIARYLADRSLTVDAFYTSNVEFYLFGRPAWPQYMANLRKLPLAPDGLFIRSYFASFGRPHPQQVRGHRSASLLQPFAALLEGDVAGTIRSYWDVVREESK